jgi:DNA-binding protein H-NS
MNLHELNTLPLHELRELITAAERVLKERQNEARKGVIAQIKALAEDIGVTVTILEEGQKADRRSSRKGTTVAPKYRNPHHPNQTWTGRGMKPRWLAELVNQGRDISEFLL